MSLPAGMQWDLLPPLSARTAGALIAGALEPAYDIAGDAFDYAINGTDLHLAIFDGLGHGLGSTLLTGLAVGVPARPPGRASLARIHAAIDAALAGRYDDTSFATGIIGGSTPAQDGWNDDAGGTRGRCCCADADSRRARCPDLPFGLGTAPRAAVAELEPDDAVLMYTDGVTEARTADGELFGLDRLVDLLEREAASGRTAEELLRRLVRAVLDHQGGAACATTPPCCWCSGPAPDRAQPAPHGVGDAAAGRRARAQRTENRTCARAIATAVRVRGDVAGRGGAGDDAVGAAMG